MKRDDIISLMCREFDPDGFLVPNGGDEYIQCMECLLQKMVEAGIVTILEGE